jgi:hypothetical protein
MEDYGIYQDRGVSGKFRKYSTPFSYKDRGVSGKFRKYNTPFSYKDKMPPPKALDKWIVRKGLKGVRNEQGQFIKRKSLQYLIARSIFRKSFEQAFEKLPKEMVDAYKLDLEEFLTHTTSGN